MGSVFLSFLLFNCILFKFYCFVIIYCYIFCPLVVVISDMGDSIDRLLRNIYQEEEEAVPVSVPKFDPSPPPLLSLNISTFPAL